MLDNAPTYLIFASLAAERAGVGGDLGALAAHAPALLAAVSVGAVFMGANTYIGNGPNLLVKAVAESAGSAKVAMPNFIAYAGFAIAILTPVYLAVCALHSLIPARCSRRAWRAPLRRRLLNEGRMVATGADGAAPSTGRYTFENGPVTSKVMPSLR